MWRWSSGAQRRWQGGALRGGGAPTPPPQSKAHARALCTPPRHVLAARALSGVAAPAPPAQRGAAARPLCTPPRQGRCPWTPGPKVPSASRPRQTLLRHRLVQFCSPCRERAAARRNEQGATTRNWPCAWLRLKPVPKSGTPPTDRHRNALLPGVQGRQPRRGGCRGAAAGPLTAGRGAAAPAKAGSTRQPPRPAAGRGAPALARSAAMTLEQR
jgi:hypothetical protein